jgi:hypothetical protein
MRGFAADIWSRLNPPERPRMKRLLPLGLALLLAAELPGRVDAQTAAFPEWVRVFDGSTGLGGPNPYAWNDLAAALAIDASGNAYLAVTTQHLFGTSLSKGLVILKYEANGDEHVFAGPVPGGDQLGPRGSIVAVVLDSDGNVVVTGTTTASKYVNGIAFEVTDIFTAKYAGDGTALWSTTFDRDGEDDSPSALAVDGGGNVYVAGQSEVCYPRLPNERCETDMVAIQYNRDGDRVWATFHDSPSIEDRARAVAVDAQGNTYLTGTATLKLDAEGTKVWALPSSGVDLALDGRGSLYVAGGRSQQTFAVDGTLYFHTDYEVTRYTDTGTVVWNASYDGASDDDEARRLAIDDAGNAFVTGRSCDARRATARDNGCLAGYSVATVKIAPDGGRLWAVRYVHRNDAVALEVDADGNAYVAAPSEAYVGAGHRDTFAVVKHDSLDGRSLWDTAQDTAHAVYASGTCCLVLDAAGNVFVAGSRFTDSFYLHRADTVTVKYSQLTDLDGDGTPNPTDNCPSVPNDQADADGDGVGDACDNCPHHNNEFQTDGDRDGAGDACDSCPQTSNPAQTDRDADGIDDACDNCPLASNSTQADADADEVGDACDNCLETPNGPRRGTCIDGHLGSGCSADGACGPGGRCSKLQEDVDADGSGDACDGDDDGDSVADLVDNCRFMPNPDQRDTDRNGVGDACNDAADTDRDEWADPLDNCPRNFNADQADTNGDGVGDVCDWDVTVLRVELTQAIQDTAGSVPLAAGKGTWIRVYVGTGTAAPIDRVTAGLRFTDATGKQIPTWGEGAPFGVLLPSGHRYITADGTPDPARITDTLNFFVSAGWFWLEPAYVDVHVSTDSVTDVRPYNNDRLTRLALRSVDPLNLVFVPVEVNGCTPTVAEFFRAASYVRSTFPTGRLNVWQSSVLHFDGDPTKEGNALVTSLWWRNFWTDDPASNMKYVGLVCDRTTIGGQGDRSGTADNFFLAKDESWFLREASTPYGGDTMAQELGHNFIGLEHTPCGNPDNPDPDYPVHPGFRRGSIGEFGFDGARVYDPATYADFMSYCGPNWVSPYTFGRLFTQFAR